MIGIVNYGFGNIQAIKNIYKTLHIPCCVAEKPEDLLSVTKIILPGVGSFDFAMQSLQDSGMKDVLEQLVLHDKTPLLGICVGMQLLANSSEEGVLPGLGWIEGRVKKFKMMDPHQPPISIPHMGWNSIQLTHPDPLFEGVQEDIGYYFLHSFYFSNAQSEDALALTDHGVNFTSAVKRGHIYGVQFHPEKSHANGVRLLKNFAEL